MAEDQDYQAEQPQDDQAEFSRGEIVTDGYNPMPPEIDRDTPPEAPPIAPEE